ncbi:MAG TPA: recombination mediator RecR [Armatimonadota bacterium]|nr:recombination mediator RecR [Armatimonadota bacterium]
MRYYPRPLARLIEELERLPGIGPKSAQRLAFHLLERPEPEARAFADAVIEVKQQMRNCSRCFNVTDTDPCAVCADERRDRGLICVVAEPRDVLAMENTGEYAGLYHVLQGLISPLENIGPEQLRVGELVERAGGGEVREVVIATNPVVEGEATAVYLAGLLKPLGVKVTRIALGLPVGGDLDYADQLTITRALQGRTEM